MNLMIKKDIINRIKNEDLLLCYFVSCLASKKVKYLKEIIHILKENGIKDRKVYETILQAYFFCGFPATIESIKIFNEIYVDFRKPKYAFNLNKYSKSDIRNCKRIYKSNFNKLMLNLSSTYLQLLNKNLMMLGFELLRSGTD